MLFKKKNKPLINLSETLYRKIILQARQKAFYSNLEVPDTIDGRFELILLHFFFIYSALNSNKYEGVFVIDQIMNIMFKDFDSNLREIGVGDLSVGKKVYKMSEALAGRIKAYGKSIKDDTNITNEVLKRNIYGTVEKVDKKSLLIISKYFSDNVSYIRKIDLFKIKDKDDIFLNMKKYIGE